MNGFAPQWGWVYRLSQIVLANPALSVAHIKAHTGAQDFLSQGNARADALAKSAPIFPLIPMISLNRRGAYLHQIFAFNFRRQIGYKADYAPNSSVRNSWFTSQSVTLLSFKLKWSDNLTLTKKISLEDDEKLWSFYVLATSMACEATLP